MNEANQEIEVLPAVADNMSIDIVDMTRHVKQIEKLANEVMKEGRHYGKIDGCGDKPTLLKPGAEMLAVAFQLRPVYTILPNSIESDDFIAYTVRCDLESIVTGKLIATGIGACNSRETKYRYRSQNTGKTVPSEYWEDRNPEILGGKQYKPRKIKGTWLIFEQVENENPWDLQNTILKMGEKRALVASTLNAVAASEFFTQDIEDFVTTDTPVKSTETSKPKSTGEGDITEKQRKAIYAISKDIGYSNESFKNDWLMPNYGVESTKDLTKQQGTEIIKKLKEEQETGEDF